MSDVKNSSLATGLVSYWELEEASGNRVDSHGSNTLTDNNTVGQVVGIQGNAADFVASNSEYLSNDGFNFGDTDFSMAGWFKIANITGNNWLITKMNTGTLCYQLYNGNADVDFAVYSGTTNLGVARRTSAISSNTWFYVVVYHNASTSQTGISVNGSAFSTASLSGNIGSSSAQFRVGSRQWFNGFSNISADEIGIWSRVLTTSDVAALYNSGAGIPYDAGGGGVTKPNFKGFARI